MNHRRVDVALGIKPAAYRANLGRADSLDRNIAQPESRRHHHLETPRAAVWNEFGQRAERVQARDIVLVVVEVESHLVDDFLGRRLIVKVVGAPGEATGLAFELGTAKAAEIRDSKRHYQTHDEDHDRDFEQREAGRAAGGRRPLEVCALCAQAQTSSRRPSTYPRAIATRLRHDELPSISSSLPVPPGLPSAPYDFST